MNKIKLLTAIFILAITATANAQITAYWTGRQEKVQTVSYKWVNRCYYRAGDRIFTKLFEESCPMQITLY